MTADFTSKRISRDANGNPRIVVHFLAFITAEESARRGGDWIQVSEKYELALRRARPFGGRKFNNKQFGGGIVFQSYSEEELADTISRALASAMNPTEAALKLLRDAPARSFVSIPAEALTSPAQRPERHASAFTEALSMATAEGMAFGPLHGGRVKKFSRKPQPANQ